MPHRHLSPFQRRARQWLGRPVYSRREVTGAPPEGAGAAGGGGLGEPGHHPRRSMLAIAYTGVRRPCICTGCICLTPAERERQKRVFGLARAVTAAHYATRH